MNASVILSHADFLLLEKEWGALISEIGEELTVFSTHQWYRCWLDSFLNDSHLFIVIIRRREELIGIAPLHIVLTKHRGLPVRKLKFIENGNSLHNDFIINPAERASCVKMILKFIYKNNKSWDIVELLNIPETSSNLSIIKESLDNDKVSFGVRPGLCSPYLVIDGSWGDYYSSRSTQTKRTFRNINNRVNKAGISELIHIENYDDYLKIRDDLYFVAKNSWTEDIGDSINSEKNKAFFDDLIKVSSEEGWLSLWGLKINNRLVAFELHLKYGHTTHGLRASFLKQMANVSPGSHLDRSIIENMFKITVDKSIYDFGGSYDDYKKKWTNDTINHTNFQVFPRALYSRFLYFYECIFIESLRLMRAFLRDSENLCSIKTRVLLWKR